MAGNSSGEWARTLEPLWISRSSCLSGPLSEGNRWVQAPWGHPAPSGADRLLRICVPVLRELQMHKEMVTTVSPLVFSNVSAGLCWKHGGQSGVTAALHHDSFQCPTSSISFDTLTPWTWILWERNQLVPLWGRVSEHVEGTCRSRCRQTWSKAYICRSLSIAPIHSRHRHTHIHSHILKGSLPRDWFYATWVICQAPCLTTDYKTTKQVASWLLPSLFSWSAYQDREVRIQGLRMDTFTLLGDRMSQWNDSRSDVQNLNPSCLALWLSVRCVLCDFSFNRGMLL